MNHGHLKIKVSLLYDTVKVLFKVTAHVNKVSLLKILLYIIFPLYQCCRFLIYNLLL